MGLLRGRGREVGIHFPAGSPKKVPLLLLDALGSGVHLYPMPWLQEGVHTAGPWWWRCKTQSCVGRALVSEILNFCPL